MSDVDGTRRERRAYTNGSQQPVLYPLGNIKVEVPAGQTLTYFTYEPIADAFQRARGRRKLMQAIAPVVVVVSILAMALIIVMFISMKASAE